MRRDATTPARSATPIWTKVFLDEAHVQKGRERHSTSTGIAQQLPEQVSAQGHARMLFQHASDDEFVQAVEAIIGRVVRALVSGSTRSTTLPGRCSNSSRSRSATTAPRSDSHPLMPDVPGRGGLSPSDRGTLCLPWPTATSGGVLSRVQDQGTPAGRDRPAGGPRRAAHREVFHALSELSWLSPHRLHRPERATTRGLPALWQSPRRSCAPFPAGPNSSTIGRGRSAAGSQPPCGWHIAVPRGANRAATSLSDGGPVAPVVHLWGG
jgi:hypothetical protein